MLRVRFWLAGLAGVVLVLGVFASGAFGAGDENVGSCGNDLLSGFSALLPDCRAYEQVSPPFKAGNKAAPVSIAADGTHVLAQSLGAFANTQADHTSEGGFYELSRSPSGWQPSALEPATIGFPAAEFEGASPSLERSLWAARTPEQSLYAEDLYVKEADGAMVKIGPALPPSVTAGPPAGEEHYFFYFRDIKFDGASDDLSHVLFSLIGAFSSFWPGDTTDPRESTEAKSLYEYTAAGSSAPVLVGVSDGTTLQEGQPLAAGELISDCDTFFGAENYSDTYNAVSPDGGTVFFTARGHSNAQCLVSDRAPAVSEVFARVGGFRTVSVSEPPSSACGCESESSVAEPAEFQGASENGVEAFFLSSQEYFPEAKGTNLYEYDMGAANGKKLIRVSTGAVEPEVLGVARVSEDGSRVYFVAKGQLTKGPRGGGCLAELDAGELAEETAAEEEEAKEEPVTSAAKCRPKKAGDNLYVYERDEQNPGGRLGFVATLTPEDAQDWSSVDSRPVQATPEGRFLVFQSTGDLTEGDGSSVAQVFEYDSQSEELVRVSVPQTGYTPPTPLGAEANASLITPQHYEGTPISVSPADRYSDLAVSGDGSTVVFVSTAALSKAAEAASGAGAQSAYEYRSTVGEGGDISEGDTYLLSDGKDVALSEVNGVLGVKVVGIDESGEDVFFETADALLAGDGDTQYDLYDARVDGGFPLPAQGVECEGEGCYGPVSVPPSLLGAAGGGLGASVNPLAPVLPMVGARPVVVKRVARCARGKGRRRRACVRAARRAKKARKAGARRSGVSGRASRDGGRGL
jgi:hypothetical protein